MTRHASVRDTHEFYKRYQIRALRMTSIRSMSLFASIRPQTASSDPDDRTCGPSLGINLDAIDQECICIPVVGKTSRSLECSGKSINNTSRRACIGRLLERPSLQREYLRSSTAFIVTFCISSRCGPRHSFRGPLPLPVFSYCRLCLLRAYQVDLSS